MIRLRCNRMSACLLGAALSAVSCVSLPRARQMPTTDVTFELPDLVGSWELISQPAIPPRELEILQADDSWRRIYRCRETDQLLVATLIAGNGGPLSCHLPETCVSRSIYCVGPSTSVWQLLPTQHRFWIQTYFPRQIDSTALTVAYAWHDGLSWRAPQMPRFQLAGHSKLQRLQVTVQHENGRSAEAKAAIQRFVRASMQSTLPSRISTNSIERGNGVQF